VDGDRVVDETPKMPTTLYRTFHAAGQRTEELLCYKRRARNWPRFMTPPGYRSRTHRTALIWGFMGSAMRLCSTR
jgi:hypothetical protein